MRGLIYPLTGLLVLAVFMGICYVAVFLAGAWHERRAIRNARWEQYSEVLDDGLIEVGVRRVARWGRHERILKRVTPVKVRDDERSEAEFQAEMRAASYNASRLT